VFKKKINFSLDFYKKNTGENFSFFLSVWRSLKTSVICQLHNLHIFNPDRYLRVFFYQIFDNFGINHFL